MMASTRYGIGADAAERARQQRDAVPDREEAHVQHDVLRAIEEEHHADQEQQMVVPGHHVLRAEVHQRRHRGAVQRLEESAVPGGDAVRAQNRGGQHAEREHRDEIG